MAKVIIDKTYWSLKRKIKYLLLGLLGKPVLKVNDHNDSNSVSVGAGTSLGECLTITLLGGGE